MIFFYISSHTYKYYIQGGQSYNQDFFNKRGHLAIISSTVLRYFSLLRHSNLNNYRKVPSMIHIIEKVDNFMKKSAIWYCIISHVYKIENHRLLGLYLSTTAIIKY